MRIASAYKLTQITDSTATLEVTSEIRPGNSEVLMTGLARAAAPFTQNKLANSKKGIDLAGIKMTVEFTGSQTGTVTIDRTRHRVSHCTMHQLVTGDLKIGIFMLPMNMDMVWRYNISDRPSRWEKLR